MENPAENLDSDDSLDETGIRERTVVDIIRGAASPAVVAQWFREQDILPGSSLCFPVRSGPIHFIMPGNANPFQQTAVKPDESDPVAPDESAHLVPDESAHLVLDGSASLESNMNYASPKNIALTHIRNGIIAAIMSALAVVAVGTAVQNVRQTQADNVLEEAYGPKEQSQVQRIIIDILQKALVELDHENTLRTVVQFRKEKPLVQAQARMLTRSIDFVSSSPIESKNIESYLIHNNVRLIYPEEPGQIIFVIDVSEDIDPCNDKIDDGFACFDKFSGSESEGNVQLKHIALHGYFNQEGQITSAYYYPVISKNDSPRLDITPLQSRNIPSTFLSSGQFGKPAQILRLLDLIHQGHTSMDHK